MTDKGASSTAHPAPVVTYTRISPDPRGSRTRAAKRAPDLDRSGPRRSPAPPVDPFDLGNGVSEAEAIEAEPVLRAGRDDFGVSDDDFDVRDVVDVDPDEFEAPRRSWSGRVVVALGVVAIAAGIGLLVGSFGSATFDLFGDRAPVLSSSDGANGPTSETGDTDGRVVRTVGAAGVGAPIVTPPVEPPLPRARPERQVASVTGAKPAPLDGAAAPASVAVAAEAVVEPAPDNDAAFIAMIERTLAANAEASKAPAPEPIRGPGVLAAPPAVMVPSPPIPEAPTPLAEIPAAATLQ